MPVETKLAAQRRRVRYESYDELLADARRLAASPHIESLDNWSAGQVFEHLARSFDSSIDGSGFSLPLPMRWLLRLFMKRRFLTQQLPAGFKSPETFVPQPTTSAAGLARLEQAIERQQRESHRAAHPAFGRITPAEWQQFHLRHAELHMSFLTNGSST